jgi:hypothetical protein
MKKVLKFLGYFVLVLIVAVAGLLIYVQAALPDVGDAPNITVDYTPQRIARGEYLANSVCVCMDCHSSRDLTKFSLPLKPGTFGMGGDRFDQSIGMPGVFYARNITPEGISRYTDGELYRVITAGVTKEGRPMFPLMPYPNYGSLADEDVYSIIAYLRTGVPAIKNDVPESEADFPVNFILRTIPKKGTPQEIPDKSDKVAYGKYLTNAGGCRECHTREKQGQIIPELQFSGGREFMLPNGSISRSANITPHETGLGKWTPEAFVARFKVYSDSSFVLPDVAPGEFNTIMPWTMYSGMEKEDLEAIFAYLQTVTPMENAVNKWTPAAK